MALAGIPKPSELWAVLKDAAREWYNGPTICLGAALSYYAVFSLAPLLIVIISVAGLLFGEEAVRGDVVNYLEDAANPVVARALEDSLRYVHVTRSGPVATVVALGIVLFSATWVFAHLQSALNTIWQVEVRPHRTWWTVIRERLLPFLMVFLCGALLVALLVLNWLIGLIDRLLPGPDRPGILEVWHATDPFVTFVVMVIIVALIYKVLPDVKLEWRDVWIGSLVTALLLRLGHWLIGLYLQWTGTASVYGAAGSLVVILLWVYYSAQVFLFGAQLTHAYAMRKHRHPAPKPNAEPIPVTAQPWQKALAR